jgi:DNA-binding NtrC family response regulator
MATAPAAEPSPAAPAGACNRAALPASDRDLQLLIEDALEDRLPGGEGCGRMGELIGASAAMQAVYRQIRQVARTEIPVLILGETGTGKELATAVIHALSSRRDGACIAVNLGALPTELVASELFGHEKGAFTGAAERRLGKFELGSGGTILLDEIDSIDAKVQVSLLRLLEQKEFHRLGGRDAIRSDARLITATNRDLARLAAEGLFREDLFYRLETFCITMPPLRERSGDVRLLSEAFLERAGAELGRGVTEIAGDALAILESYAWPGNVRELRNVIQRAVLLCSGRRILPRHLPERLRPAERRPPSGIPFPIGMPLHEVERDMIRRVLASTMNNRTRAAELLGITRRSLYSKLNKHGIGACEHAAQGA